MVARTAEYYEVFPKEIAYLIIFPEWEANSANDLPDPNELARSIPSSSPFKADLNATLLLEKCSYSALLTS